MVELDVAGATENFGGDAGLYAQVAEIFLEDSLTQAHSLETALAAADFKTARRIAHTVKGTAAALGAEQLRVKALALEKACDAGDANLIGQADGEFRAMLDDTRAALRQHMAS